MLRVAQSQRRRGWMPVRVRGDKLDVPYNYRHAPVPISTLASLATPLRVPMI